LPIPRTAAATVAASEAHRRHAAERAIDDPAKLSRAARIVRLAIERKRLSIEDLTAPSTRDASAVA